MQMACEKVSLTMDLQFSVHLWTDWQEGWPHRPLCCAQLLSSLGTNHKSFKDSCQVLELTSPHKELKGIPGALLVYPTCRTVETGFLVPESLPTIGRLLDIETQAAHKTDSTDQEWHTTFLVVVLVANLQLQDVLFAWRVSE